MRKYSWVLFAAFLSLTACEQSSASLGGDALIGAGQATSVTLEEAIDEKNADKVVAVEGYLQLPQVLVADAEQAQVNFHARPLQRRGTTVFASLKLGDCANCMAKLPATYKLSDLKVFGNEQQPLSQGQRLRLTGILSMEKEKGQHKRRNAKIKVDKIEELENAVFDYVSSNALEINKENVGDSTLDGDLVRAVGRVAIPQMLFVKDDVMMEMMVGGDTLGVSFLIGNGANQIDPIPSNFSKSDFKIHDHQGALIDLRKPVTVWGTRLRGAGRSRSTIYVEHIEQ